MKKTIEIVNRISNQLKKIDNEPQVYQIIYSGLKEIIPNVYFLITKLQPDDMNFRIIHSSGFEKFINPIKTLLRKNPFEMDFPYNDLDDVKQKAFEDGKLFMFEDGLYGLVNGIFNKTICKSIERILGISQTYAISFSVKKKHLGGASFFIPSKTFESGIINEEVKTAIEIIAFQTSQAINSLRQINALKEKENDLIVSQSRFNQLLNLMSDIVWKANGDGSEIIDLNDSFIKYYGFHASDFSKNPNLWFEVIHPDDKEIAQQASKNLFIKGKTECEYRIIRPDGKVMWLHDRKSVIFDKQGSPVQMGGIAKDITKRKVLEEQLKLKNYALENSPSPILLLDLNGKVFYVNNAFIKLWGFNKKTEITGKHISMFASNKKQFEDALNALKTGKTFSGEDNSIRKDGTNFKFIFSSSVVYYEKNAVCIMTVFTDITERSKMEAELREHETKLTKLNKEKDKFFSIVSHDLKSPLSGMLGLLDILANKYFEYTDEERFKIFQSAYQSAQKSFNLLSDLLEWAKLQNKNFEIKKETLNLKEIINENIELYKKNALVKEIIIKNHIDSDIYISVDRNSMYAVVRNLLNNAIKFTKNGGFVEFEGKQSNNDTEIIIKDSGIGMSQTTINKLFRINENITKPGTNNEKGTGLGLIICNDLVVKNNWKMNVESEPGKGTSITILVPK